MSSILSKSSATISARSPETHRGTVTKWVPITTTFAANAGCDNAIISAISGNLTGFDPGYAITVDASTKCWPSAATTWWNQDNPATTISLGPVVCPDAYYTATMSAKDATSTLVACCPSNYQFQSTADILIVEPLSQCISAITSGQVFEFASNFGGKTGWIKTSATATSATSVVGVPFNGWRFNAVASSTSSAAAAPIPTSPVPAATSTSTPAPTSGPTHMGSGLTTRAKVGIGVGVAVGVILLLALLLWIILDPLKRWRHHQMADRVEAASRAQGRGPSPPAPPTPPSLRELAIPSPSPPAGNISPIPGNMSPSLGVAGGRAMQMSPLSSGHLSDSGGSEREPTDMIEIAGGPGPVFPASGTGYPGYGSSVGYAAGYAAGYGAAIRRDSQSSQRTKQQAPMIPNPPSPVHVGSVVTAPSAAAATATAHVARSGSNSSQRKYIPIIPTAVYDIPETSIITSDMNTTTTAPHVRNDSQSSSKSKYTPIVPNPTSAATYGVPSAGFSVAVPAVPGISASHARSYSHGMVYPAFTATTGHPGRAGSVRSNRSGRYAGSAVEMAGEKYEFLFEIDGTTPDELKDRPQLGD